MEFKELFESHIGIINRTGYTDRVITENLGIELMEDFVGNVARYNEGGINLSELSESLTDYLQSVSTGLLKQHKQYKVEVSDNLKKLTKAKVTIKV